MPAVRPAPLTEFPLAAAGAAVGVMSDIDDTLTTDGAITPEALGALARLRDAGLPVIAITGRPMGWSLPFARDWPVAAIVAENGAVALLPGGRVDYVQDEPTRRRNALRLQAVASRVLAEVDGARLARDSAGRVTDIAIDHAEFAQLAPASIDRVVAIMRSEGMNASVSSIHINGWFGAHDKASGARWIVERLYGRCLDDEIDGWVYVGDSTNDQAMFEAFVLSVGVANLMQFADRLSVWPAYITRAERGAGFKEVADLLLAVGGRRPPV
ncbi:MAG: HAD-IIB family hydrolase [Burkholderiaceae bacterium]